MRIAGIAILVVVSVFSSAFAGEAVKGPRSIEKKLVEYGWDVPTPAFIRAHIGEMTRRPFDGVVFKLEGGGKVLEPVAWDEAAFAADFENLAAIEWGTFSDNFVILWAASDQDWFNDEHWAAIEHNVGIVAKAARVGRCAGVCWDPEPYGADPWAYNEAAHRDTKSFAEYEAVARRRGGQFLNAIAREMPDPHVLTLFQLTFLDDLCRVRNPEMRAKSLAGDHYGLLPAFLEGMLDAASPGAVVTDGNEGAYYYTDSRDHFEAYHTICERGRYLISPDRWPAYRAHVQVGQALYVDQYFGMRTDKVLGHSMTPEERPLWMEHNTYWSLYTADKYVWCYSERMNWWTGADIPPGCEEAIRSARDKIESGLPLGFDLAPVVKAAEERQ